MLFNSYIFIFSFLPITIILFFLLSRYSQKYGICCLVLASIFFYGYWNISYVPLLLGSIFLNYSFGALIKKAVITKKTLLILGVSCNLLILGYYKYFSFFLSILNESLGTNFSSANIFLPLGISFFTFTQIAYLVDTYRNQIYEKSPLHYALFVAWFPQLIAGPIFHHREMMPQFTKSKVYQFNWDHIMIGITVFSIGLFKKSFLADNISHYISDSYALSPFLRASNGFSLDFFEAWSGALAYTLQLYFDFSGYSDMAIGLGWLFGIKLPMNFNSPYRACNIIDFWRRWHMTLSRFLRDYVYIPLGGSRYGLLRKHINLFITMLLGGLWHGAGWTFVLWGMMHGTFLIINHSYKQLCERFAFLTLNKAVALIITFVSVVIAWVVFRASNMSVVINFLSGMFGFHGFSLPKADYINLGILGFGLENIGVTFKESVHSTMVPIFSWVAALLSIVFCWPNTQTIMAKAEITLNTLNTYSPKQQGRFLVWSPTKVWAFITASIFVIAISQLAKPNEFLYFQF